MKIILQLNFVFLKQLLIILKFISLHNLILQPFWPTGSGCARGFLGAMDVAWMIRGFSLGIDSIDLIQERESIFNNLSQTKPDTLMKFHEKYSIDPFTR